MDRISALRNVEDALQDFEDGEIDLMTMDVRIRSVIRTYATNFGTYTAYRAIAPPAVEGVIVAAETPTRAKAQMVSLADADVDQSDIELADTI
ncbi:DUF7854 family protein [Halocatena halophila]|uniref:DUF7854 family protein n=1 Tax=Halocatena halophila TaxID=2814576 RepID=UPI002ED16409